MDKSIFPLYDNSRLPELPEFTRQLPKERKIGKLDIEKRIPSFDGSIYDAIDGRPIVIEDGKVDSMKSLWECRKGFYWSSINCIISK